MTGIKIVFQPVSCYPNPKDAIPVSDIRDLFKRLRKKQKTKTKRRKIARSGK